jgi:3'(2'), 5'-bisphosphate nucleotidase
MNEQLRAILPNPEARYPHALESKFTRVLSRILELWDTPDIHAYFFDLMVDTRGNRQGFPDDVATDIVFLHSLLKREEPAQISDAQRLLDAVIDIAQQAGAAIMEIYAEDRLVVDWKANDSPLTSADLAAHYLIEKGLRKVSEYPVLSEESGMDMAYAQRKGWYRYWLVDPLDGTKEFIKRNGQFTVNIALIENGNPILGVVYAPALNTLYFAARGLGAYKKIGDEMAHPIHALAYSNEQIAKVVASASHPDARLEDFLAQYPQHDITAMGSSLKLCLVAEGSAHFYPRFGPTMEWDTAAAHCVVQEAGAQVYSMDDGQVLRYNKEDLYNPSFLVQVRTVTELELL